MKSKSFSIAFNPILEEIPQNSNTPLTSSDVSGPITHKTANDYINYYDKMRLKDANGAQLALNGFNFDANDLMKLLGNMNLKKDKLYVALGYTEDPDGSNRDKGKYTLVLACSIYNEAAGVNELVFDELDHPWYEYSKPCPDACPRR